MVHKVARFSHFAAIDWSGAKGSRHKGIAVAVCTAGDDAPDLVLPPNGIWSRTEILEWLLDQTGDMIIGFDFSFAPPSKLRGAYLPGENTPQTAKPFWQYVDHICGDEDLGAVSFLEQHHRKHFYLGMSDGRKADYMHLRRCEAHYNLQGGGKPSTIYDAIGAAQVAKASFAGMRLLHHVNQVIPIWPFDALGEQGPLIVEIYSQIASRAAGMRKGRSKIRSAEALDTALSALGSKPHTPMLTYNDHATDAIITAAWLRQNVHNQELWSPAPLTEKIASTEGWTFGVV